MLDQLLRLSNVNTTEIQKARDLMLVLYINMTCYKIPPLGKKSISKIALWETNPKLPRTSFH